MEMSHISEKEKNDRRSHSLAPSFFFFLLDPCLLKSMKQLPLALLKADTEIPDRQATVVT